MNPNSTPWTNTDICILKREYQSKTNAQLARILGRSVYAINVKASLLGLRKPKAGIIWSKQQLYTLRTFFPTMFNRDLAKLIGVSPRTLIRKARELGLEKSPTFHSDKKNDINRRASESLKKKYETGVCKSHFVKGVHNNPDGEFKIGHVESPEIKVKRSAALKRAWQRRKLQERVKVIYTNL